MSTVALVTGASQGLGLALVDRLSARLGPHDTIYLTGRHPGRVADAAQAVAGAVAHVEGEVLDVSDAASVQRAATLLAERHGGVDIVFSNAYRRVRPDDDPAAVIDEYVQTNNLGTTRMMRAFLPLLRDDGRMLVVASTMGTLQYLPPVLHDRFDNLATLDEVDHAVDAWRAAVAEGRAPGEGWPGFINIPSKIAQVAAVRAVASSRRHEDLQRGRLIAAVCPGMLDTGASRPWFDMSLAQPLDRAAEVLVDLALDPALNPDHYGQLIRFGEVLPWAA